jgi:hypothetical protein
MAGLAGIATLNYRKKGLGLKKVFFATGSVFLAKIA